MQISEPGSHEPRDLDLLPKAHLHLHFTGSLTIATLVELAAEAGLKLPPNLTDQVAIEVPYTQRGWWRFQHAYDLARRAVRSEKAMRRVVESAALADQAEGCRRMEIQIDPTSYAPYVGGIVNALDIVMDEATKQSTQTGVQIGVIVAASRMRHPLDARTLARLAAKHVGTGPGKVCGFGLSNDERAGNTDDWAKAFEIARNAGIPGVPHGGELLGADHLLRVVDQLQPTRIGHGVRAVEDEHVLATLIERGIAFEVCPSSNVQLGVYRTLSDVPLTTLIKFGARIALGADDPLLFLSRLTDQYRIARDAHSFDDAGLAELAKASIRASFAAEADKQRWFADVDEWLRPAR